MAFYYQLTGGKRTRQRVARRLLALREQLDREIPCRTRIDTLLLATWNIREFDTGCLCRAARENDGQHERREQDSRARQDDSSR